ncbi:hypothetical protein INT47_011777 [Mucor saturninus]|uniref:Uncharacterized protein n=1 Tax=Mucor saturninus TaxID=64648 RepID=A0A8H7QF58_9FUNG|nr:hypothetical protein INT47_011777 [Mucor saturninus]
MPSAYGLIEDNEGFIEAHLKDTRLIKVDDVQVLFMLLESHQESGNPEARNLSDLGDPPFILRINNHCLRTASKKQYDRKKQQYLSEVSHLTPNSTNIITLILSLNYNTYNLCIISTILRLHSYWYDTVPAPSYVKLRSDFIIAPGLVE